MAQFCWYCSRNLSMQIESFPIPTGHCNKAINDIKELSVVVFNFLFKSMMCSISLNGASPLDASPRSPNIYAPHISSTYITRTDVLTALLSLKPKYN